MASLHFSSLCCRARRVSLNGYLHGDQHVWRLFKVLSVVLLMLVLGLALEVSGDKLHGLSALQLALLSCSKGVTQWLPSQ